MAVQAVSGDIRNSTGYPAPLSYPTPPSDAPPRPGTVTTPTVASPAPLGSVALDPGYTPDYKALIFGDPAYLANQNNSELDVNQAAAMRKAALQALVVGHGGAGTFKDAYGDIDQNTLDLAKGNQFSDAARLQLNYDQGVDAFKRALSARGGLSSGDLGYGLDQADRARGTSEYDMGQQFGNSAQSIINQYLGVESQARRSEVGAIQAAAADVYGNPTNRPTPATSASLDPDWQSKYGQPVYNGPDGSLYTLGPGGTLAPYTPAPPPPPPAAPAGSTDNTYYDYMNSM